MRYKQKSVGGLTELGIYRYARFQEEIFICSCFFYDELSALISRVLSPLERIPIHIREKGNAAMASDRTIIESVISHTPGAKGHAAAGIRVDSRMDITGRDDNDIIGSGVDRTAPARIILSGLLQVSGRLPDRPDLPDRQFR